MIDPARAEAESRVAEMVARAIADPMFWVPVRHHSPTVARLVEHEIARRKPKIVFLEGPAEAQAMVPHVIDRATKPPVAIYSSFRDDDDVLGLREASGRAEPVKIASWYPLASYSPEYVAMKTASAVGAEVVFVDLPHWAIPRRKIETEREPAATEPPIEEDDSLLARSDFYAAIARASGYRTFNEAWDTLFESLDPTRGAERARGDLLAFCAGARATTPVARIESDGTLARERFMARTIRATLAARELAPSDAMVVCGGFHVFLDPSDPVPPPDIPRGTVHTTVVPYGFSRLASQRGYGAGNRAPQFYETLFEGRRRGTRTTEILAEHALSILAKARAEGEALAAADAIAVTHQTHLLAAIRGRSEPVLDDLHDALVTCCVKGAPDLEGAALQRAISEIDIGHRVGRVTDAVGRLPIAADFYASIDALGLGALFEGEKRLTRRLDLREPAGAAESAFLHRLVHLGVPIGDMQRAADALEQSIHRENWRIAWSPAIDEALIERSLDGDTIETAAATMLGRKLAASSGDAGATAAELVAAVDMSLPGIEAATESACAAAIDADARFVSLTRALASLLLLDRRAAYRELRRAELKALAERAYDRACFALADAALLGEDEQRAVVGGLRTLAERVLARDPSERALFVAHVESALVSTPFPFLRGTFLGALVEVRAAPIERVTAALRSCATGTVERRAELGDLLCGVLSVSRTAVALGARALVEAIDEALNEMAPDDFLAVVPRLRAAMEVLHRSQRDAIAREVAGLYGAEASALTARIETSTAAAALIAELDAEVARIMEVWSFG
jgi:hypothetical protein